jgi:hypothetical protein
VVDVFNNLDKILLYGALLVFMFSLIANIDSTLHFHSTQYVPEGESPDPLRISQFLNDLAHPIKDSLVLVALSFIVKYCKNKSVVE